MTGDLRKELIFEDYDSVDWKAARSFIAKEDLYTPHSIVLESFFGIVNLYEKVAISWLRQKALDWVYAVLEYVTYRFEGIAYISNMSSLSPLCIPGKKTSSQSTLISDPLTK